MSHDIEPRTQIATPSAEDLRKQLHPEHIARTDKWGRGKVVGALGAGVAVALGAGLGAQHFMSHEAPAPVEQETPDANQSPAPVETTPAETDPTNPANTVLPENELKTPEDLVDPSEIPSNNVELGTFVQLPPETQARVRELGAMDTQTFRAQPYEEQLAFLKQVFDNHRPIADWLLEQNNVKLVYTDNPTTTQQAADNIAYVSIVANHLVQRAPDESIVFDTALSQKLASLNMDVRVLQPTRWDEITSSFSTVYTLYSYDGDYNNNKCTVANDEPLPAEGTITTECTSLAGISMTYTLSRVNYTDLQGNPSSTMVLTNVTTQ